MILRTTFLFIPMLDPNLIQCPKFHIIRLIPHQIETSIVSLWNKQQSTANPTSKYKNKKYKNTHQVISLPGL